MGCCASVCQPSTLRMLMWPEASSAQNSMAAVSAEGSTVCVLIRRLNSSCRRSTALVTGMMLAASPRSAGTIGFSRMVRPSGLRGAGSMKRGQADAYDELRARVSSWPPLRPARLRCERGSVVVVQPTAPEPSLEGDGMTRVIGMDVHRTFAEVVFCEDGRLRWYGRVDMTRSGLEGFGRDLANEDEVVVEATGN